jgi:calcium/proton exchanger cax
VTLLFIYACFVHFQVNSGSAAPLTRAQDEEAHGKDYSLSHEDLTDNLPLKPISARPEHHVVPLVAEEHIDPSADPEIGKMSSVVLLLISAGLASLCAEYLVGSIEHVIADAPLTEAFLGLIILPLLGNAAELATAVTVAAKAKIDLAINVAVGSAIQIALFMAPAMVLLGWATGKELSLFFDMFQTVALLATLMIVNIMMLSGRSNYLLGVLLCACYVVIG